MQNNFQNRELIVSLPSPFGRGTEGEGVAHYEELEVLNAEARELEERISENVGKLLA